MTTRDILKGLGLSEARLASLGMAAPPTTAPAATTEPINLFRAKYAEYQARANAPKPVALPSAQGAIDAAKVYAQYRGGNAVEKAFLREHHGAAVELGRRITLVESPETAPEPPPKSAA